MDNILSIKNFPLDKIKLKSPKPLQGGTYYSKLIVNDEKPIFIQTPKCYTKNGIHKTGKKIYCDLKFDSENDTFINWLMDIEKRVRDLIFEKREIWFHDEPSMEEIEYNWNTSIRTNKNNYLVRTFIQRDKNSNYINLQIWDSDQNAIKLDDILVSDKLVSILEIQGLKYTSQSFHLEICMRQIMIIKELPIFNKCLIQLNNNTAGDDAAIKNKINIEKNIENFSNNTDNNSDSNELNNLEPIDNFSNNDIANDNDLEEKDVDKTSVKETQDKSLNEVETIDSVEKKEQHTSENVENKEIETVDDKTDDIIEENTKQDLGEKIDKEEVDNDIDQETLADSNNEEVCDKEDNNNESNNQNVDTLEKSENDLEEVELNFDDSEESIKLKNPKDVYLEIYRVARQKAKEAKKQAIKAYLEAKKIKETYLLDEFDESDDDEIDIFEN
tara:strand:- start:1104 stop:2432 length:1329 start_codon:yes stop_codon:yes gene_type:complete